MLIFLARILIFVTLAVILIWEIERDSPFFHYTAMASSLNYRFLQCDMHSENINGEITTIEDCTNSMFLVEKLLLGPLTVLQLYILKIFRTIQLNIKQQLNKPIYDE